MSKKPQINVDVDLIVDKRALALFEVYKARVEEAGGEIGNELWTKRAFQWAFENGLNNDILRWWSLEAGRTVNENGVVTRLFDLGSKNLDVVHADPDLEPDPVLDTEWQPHRDGVRFDSRFPDPSSTLRLPDWVQTEREWRPKPDFVLGAVHSRSSGSANGAFFGAGNAWHEGVVGDQYQLRLSNDSFIFEGVEERDEDGIYATVAVHDGEEKRVFFDGQESPTGMKVIPGAPRYTRIGYGRTQSFWQGRIAEMIFVRGVENKNVVEEWLIEGTTGE